MNTKQFLSDILDEFNKIDYVKPEDIPNIDLYMDQVTTFMDSQLATSKRHEDDKILTKTMINNYAKNDLLPPPVKKKYSKEHVLLLIFIYYYKGIIPMNEIQTLLKPLTDRYFQNGQVFDLERVYKEVVVLEKEQLEDLGTVWRTRGPHAIHCLTVIGQIEGHVEAPQGQKTTKYEHVIPQLVAVQEDPAVEGLLVLINTVGGDVEAGLALAELIASISKPSATVVLGGGHSIGIPLAVSARRSFIVPTATMTVHPVRHSGMILGVPQTMRWFEQMQERITGFVAGHSGITAARYSELMLRTGELVMDVGTMLDGKKAVKEKLIDQLGGISDALDWLYREIERTE